MVVEDEAEATVDGGQVEGIEHRSDLKKTSTVAEKRTPTRGHVGVRRGMEAHHGQIHSRQAARSGTEEWLKPSYNLADRDGILGAHDQSNGGVALVVNTMMVVALWTLIEWWSKQQEGARGRMQFLSCVI